MDHLKLDKSLKIEAVLNFFEYLKQKVQINDQLPINLTSTESIKIFELQNKFPDIDWLQGINRQLLKHSRVTEDETITIERPQLFGALYEAIIKFDRA